VGNGISDGPSRGPFHREHCGGHPVDHEVVLPDGAVVHNPLRVLPNDGGSEVVFSLFQRAGMTDDDFEGDAKAVRADLDRLAAIFDR